MRHAASAKDARLLTSLVATAEYVCVPEAVILDVPACRGEPAGTLVQAVLWQVYCTACDASGYATRNGLREWLGTFFTNVENTAPDEYGPAAFMLIEESIVAAGESVYVSATGIAEQTLFGFPRRLGRWVITFQLEEVGGSWWIIGLKLADPDASSWVLPLLEGTSPFWTPLPSID